MKVISDKKTGKVVGHFSGNKSETDYLDKKKFKVDVFEGEELPDRKEACLVQGKKITVNPLLKAEASANDEKSRLIEERKDKILEQQAIAELEAEGKI